MIIKKHKNKNQYAVVDGVYVRDFTAFGPIPVDINRLYTEADHALNVANELENMNHRTPSIDNEQIQHHNVVIVSDGYDFKNKQKLLALLPKDVAIIAVNGALKKWQLVGDKSETKRAINYYVTNNPYEECLNYLPTEHRYYPKCVASTRTNPKFIRLYQGLKYFYCPTENEVFSGIRQRPSYRIDDYRNPICAALGLAYRFKAFNILLFCCDDSFVDERPSAIQLENGLWCYQQQIMSQKIIEANCFWLKSQNIKVNDFSSGIKYDNAPYINLNEAEMITRYFENE
jgi:hypothetical protein